MMNGRFDVSLLQKYYKYRSLSFKSKLEVRNLWLSSLWSSFIMTNPGNQKQHHTFHIMMLFDVNSPFTVSRSTPLPPPPHPDANGKKTKRLSVMRQPSTCWWHQRSFYRQSLSHAGLMSRQDGRLFWTSGQSRELPATSIIQDAETTTHSNWCYCYGSRSSNAPRSCAVRPATQVSVKSHLGQKPSAANWLKKTHIDFFTGSSDSLTAQWKAMSHNRMCWPINMAI